MEQRIFPPSIEPPHGLTLAHYQKDPETGFLFLTRGDGLGIKRKQHFLELLRDAWPNISGVCETMDLSRDTVDNHLRIDSRFRAKVKAIETIWTDRIEGVLVNNALTGKGFMDRIAYLRAHRPEKYRETIGVQVSGSITHEDAIRKRAALNKFVDAELVDAIIPKRAMNAPGQGFMVPGSEARESVPVNKSLDSGVGGPGAGDRPNAPVDPPITNRPPTSPEEGV